MRRSIRRLGAAAAALPMILAPVAAAEDTPAPAPTAQELETQRLTALAALVEAQNKLRDAQNAGFKAQMEALGLPKTEGRTTLGTDAGKMETWMLAASTLDAAATEINKVHWAGSIVLLDSDDTFDLSRGAMLRREIIALSSAFDAAAGPNCGRGVALAVPPLAVIGTILSLLRTDTEISGLTVENAEGALLNAIAAKGAATGRYVIPAAIVRVSDTGETATELKKLIDMRQLVPACRSQIQSSARTAAQKKEAAAKISVIEALATRIDAYLTAIGTRSEGKPSELDMALLGDTIIEQNPNLRVMRVKLEKAGGTLLKRANLFTMLGAPAVGITGGAVISWNLTDPETGKVHGGGVLVCRTKLTNLGDIQRGHVRPSACGVEVKDPKYEETVR